MKTKIFATLGPAGSNHDLNTRRYIDFHGLDAKVEYFASFIEGLKAMKKGRVDFMIQICVHPDVALVIEHDYKEIFLVDSFIGTTKAMGVLARGEIEDPKSLGYMVATRGYFDPSAWPIRKRSSRTRRWRKVCLPATTIPDSPHWKSQNNIPAASAHR